jgi:hypothetical protein
MKIKERIASIFSTWKKLAYLLRKYPSILTPFLWIIGFEAILLTILFLAPRYPLSILLAPPIRAFWGEKYLHYPLNFLLLPQLFEVSRNTMSFIIGVFLSAIAVSFVSTAEQGQQTDWWTSIKIVTKRYFRLVFVWAITLGTLFFIVKVLKFAYPVINSKPLFFTVEFFVTMLVQMFFVFSIPAVVLENKKVYAAIWRSIGLFRSYFFETLIFVLLPGLLLIPVSYLLMKMPYIMAKTFPEIALYILGSKIVIVDSIDFIITASATLFLLIHREKGID